MCAVGALGSIPVAAAARQDEKPAPQPPAALRAFEQARRAIVSGRIEWSVTPEEAPDRTLTFVSRYARNGDMIYENRGDAEGWTIFNQQTGEGFRKYPQLYMVNAEGVWHFEESTPGCGWWPTAWVEQQPPEAKLQFSHVRDVRTVGVAPFSGSMEYSRGLAALWPSAEDPVERWSEQQAGDRFIVRGEHRSGAVQTWYIAADRGWNAERITLEFRGRPVYEVQCALEKFGDVWFPAEARYYSRGAPSDCVTITKASFNSALDAGRFTPADLGLEPGSTINEVGATRGGLEHLTWTGAGIVTFGEWLEGVKAGKWAWGPIHRALQATGVFESPYDQPQELKQRRLRYRAEQARYLLTRNVGMWEKYVREFIERYELDQGQREKANLILLDCQRRGQEILQRRRSELSEIAAKLLDASEAGRTEEVGGLKLRLQQGLRPIEAIFEESLKPRLEKLPTREQRRKAEAAAATQPAAPADKTP
ncbi:MAG: hypothetical protein LC135_12130 [Phycisphaerae bacterium]|nr:hypothetical protein [Phycisphaerae bacterium]MCZ2400598.1 hypothetical protein [Phycisphaerae bacterium]